jgi:hypothetical protein
LEFPEFFVLLDTQLTKTRQDASAIFHGKMPQLFSYTLAFSTTMKIGQASCLTKN